MSKRPADPRLDGLFDLALRDGVDIRPTLLRVLTDLYVQKPSHTQDEETQYVELASGLIEAVDPATRATVAARLRDYPAAPAAVRRKLEDVAAPAEEDLAELFFSAAPDERRLILANLVITADAPAARAAAETLTRLEAAALRRNPAEFSRILRAALGLAPRLAERIVQDASGEPLIVAAKALGMHAPALQRILLLLDPAIGQSVQRVYELARLFDELSPQAARQMLTIWRAAAPARKPAHEPATVDDERRRPRAFASHGRNRAAWRNGAPSRTAERKRDEG